MTSSQTRRSTAFKTSLVLATLAWLPLAQAANLSKDEYKAGKDRIAAQYKTAKAACAPMTGNAKDICQEEAKATDKVALAELEVNHTGSASDQKKLAKVKADTAYDVAKERCDDKTGNDKDVCVKEAKAVHVKALADQKMAKEVGEARQDAMADKRDADYKVAAEKCDAMSGDAKTACVTAAKARFGKT